MPGQQILEDDRRKVDAKFLCSKCELLLIEPMQTFCGHLMCKSCLQLILRSDNPLCPKDETPLNESNIFWDAYTKRELMTLQLHCRNSECDWFGPGKDLQAHIDECGYTVIKCVHSQCNTEVKRNLLAKHLEEECLYRSVQCENCQETLSFASLKKHITERCPAAPVTCGHCELTNIPRRELKKHEIEDCEEIPVECDFKSVGCDYSEISKRKELRKHYKDAYRFHIQLLLRYVFEVQGEIQNFTPLFESFATKQAVSSQVNRIKDAISAEIRNMETKFTAMMTTVTTLIRKVENGELNEASTSHGSGHGTEIRRLELKLGKEIEKLQTKNNRLEAKLREKTELLERYENKMEEIDQSVAVLTASFAELEPRETVQTKVNHNGVLMWKIEGFQRKRQGAINGVKTATLKSSGVAEKLVMERKLTGLERQIENLEREMSEMRRRIDQIDASLALSTVKITDMESKNIPHAEPSIHSYNGTLLWKIDGYQRKRQDAINGVRTALFSCPFYSAKFGYKMCAKIFLNGGGQGKGTHLSLCLVILRGDYDALQTWPF